MFFKMNRTQTGDRGTLHAGVIYDASKDPKLAAEAKKYVDVGFAEQLTKKQLDALTKAANAQEASKAPEKSAAQE